MGRRSDLDPNCLTLRDSDSVPERIFGKRHSVCPDLVQTVCKYYQQTTKVAAIKEMAKGQK